MSKLLTILIFLFASIPDFYAQTITGIVKSNKGAAIKNATVSLLKASDSSLVKMQVSKEDGSFQFYTNDTGNFVLSASSVGYQLGYFKVHGKAENIEIVLEPLSSEMKVIVVKSTRQAVQIKEDRTIDNVEGTINAAGSNALEMLRKSPGVNVNSEERISMNGKSGVQVFIDGKPTPLAGADLAAYLKSIQSSEMEAIELITHPSARYEAAGMQLLSKIASPVIRCLQGAINLLPIIII
jgi:iron complex outermembrane recepter protein